MKKLFCISLVLGLIVSCSHQNSKSEGTSDYLANYNQMEIERAPAAGRCPDLIKPFIHATSKTKSSDQMWADLNEKIIEEFEKGLNAKPMFSEEYRYTPDLSHVQILKKAFKIKVGEKLVQTVGTITSTYNKFMEDLVSKKIISKDDVLKPAFVFITEDEKFIWKQFGEEVPEGSTIWGGVLTSDTYNQMIKDGFFPLGSEEHTPTRISAFEHDLAHLTGFMENPDFMKAIKKLSTLNLSNLTQNQQMRAYFFNEGTIAITSANDKVLMKLLKLSDEMKLNPSNVSYDEMLTFLKGLSDEELEKTRLALLRSNKYYTVSGGAGREPISRNAHAFHDIISSKQGSMTKTKQKADGEYGPVVVVEQLAAFQVIMLRLREVKMDDWLYTINQTVPKDSPVYKLFIDKKVWSDDEIPFGVSSSPYELRRVFLNDEIGTVDTEI